MVQLLVAAEGKLLVKPIEENKGVEYFSPQVTVNLQSQFAH
jgi:hypothetical protein